MPRSGPGPATRLPFINTSPSLGVSNPAIIRSRVDLPQPEAPIRLTNSPRAISRLTARSASISPPAVTNRLLTASILRIGLSAGADARGVTLGRSATRSAMLRAPAQDAAAQRANRLIGQISGEADHDHPGDHDIGARHLARILDHRAEADAHPADLAD